MRRLAATLLPLALAAGLIAAEGDENPTMVECDGDVLAQGETDEFQITSSPVPFPQQNGPRNPDDEPFYSQSVVQFEAAYTNDVDAMRGIATITLTFDGTQGDIDVYAYDSEGSLVAESTGSQLQGESGEQILLTFDPCETYTFDVQNWAAVGPVDITVTMTVDAKYPRR